MNAVSKSGTSSGVWHYNSGRTYPLRKSVDFWSRSSTLDMLRKIVSLGAGGNEGAGEYVLECVENMLIDGTDDESVLYWWDDYFLLRYLQQDVLHCPDLLSALDRLVKVRESRMLLELSKTALVIPTKTHIKAWKKAHSITIALQE